MSPADPLADQLAELTDALDEPGADLGAIIAVLADDVRGAVGSFLGLTIHLAVEGIPFLLTAIGGEHIYAATTSLRIPLHVPGSPAAGHIIFYAKNANAFSGLAHDAGRSPALTLHIILDQDLPQETDSVETNGHADQRDINQAIGVLIERGQLPDQAREQLTADAAENNIPVAEVARRLLNTLAPTPPGKTG